MPLTPAVYHILLALVPGELHGYAIMQAITTLSGGAVQVGPGTLYRSIQHLLEQGWIAESGERPDPALDDARRRYFRLTDAGRRSLSTETERLERLVTLARARLSAI